jgi:hypothetical protein
MRKTPSSIGMGVQIWILITDQPPPQLPTGGRLAGCQSGKSLQTPRRPSAPGRSEYLVPAKPGARMLQSYRPRPCSYVCRGHDSCRASLGFCRHTEPVSRDSKKLFVRILQDAANAHGSPVLLHVWGPLVRCFQPPRAARHQQTPTASRDDEMSPKAVKKETPPHAVARRAL